jgi:hypothetical protein
MTLISSANQITLKGQLQDWRLVPGHSLSSLLLLHPANPQGRREQVRLDGEKANGTCIHSRLLKRKVMAKAPRASSLIRQLIATSDPDQAGATSRGAREFWMLIALAVTSERQWGSGQPRSFGGRCIQCGWFRGPNGRLQTEDPVS